MGGLRATDRAENSVDGVGDVWGEPLRGNFNQLQKLKAKYPDLRINISLGGWTGSKYFSDACPDAREPRRRSSRPAWICSSRATCRSSTTPAARAPRPASSTASTSTGSGRAPRATPEHHPARGQAELHAARGGVPRAARRVGEGSQGLPADGVPAGGAQHDRRRVRGGRALRVARLRHVPGLRPGRPVGPLGHEPPLAALLSNADPSDRGSRSISRPGR